MRWLRRLRRWLRWHRPRGGYNGPPFTLAQIDAVMKEAYAPALRAALMDESPLMRLLNSLPRPEPAPEGWLDVMTDNVIV